MRSRELIKLLESKGWEKKNQRGSHVHFIHPDRPGQKVTIPHHKKDLKPKTLASILKQVG